MLDAHYPTDRDAGAPEYGGVGVDTVAFQGITSDDLLYVLREQRFDRDVDFDTGEINEVTRFSRMSLRIGLAWGRLLGFTRHGVPYLRVEVSLPVLLGGHN